MEETSINDSYRYVTVVLNQEAGAAVWFGAECKKERVKKFYALLTPAPCAAIEAVAMDMWDNFTVTETT